MKTKITQFVPTLFVLAVISFRYFSQWCILTNSLCYGTWVHNIYNYVTSPLYFFALYFLPLAIILVFIPRSIFNSWLKFAVWALPLALIFTATTSVNWTGIGINFFPFYRDDAARLAGGVFAAASLILIIWKSFAARRESESVKV